MIYLRRIPIYILLLVLGSKASFAQAGKLLWQKFIDANPYTSSLSWLPTGLVDPESTGPIFYSQSTISRLDANTGALSKMSGCKWWSSPGSQYATNHGYFLNYRDSTLRFIDLATRKEFAIYDSRAWGDIVLAPDASYWIASQFSNGSCGPCVTDLIYEALGDPASYYEVAMWGETFVHPSIAADGSKLIGWDGVRVVTRNPKCFKLLDSLWVGQHIQAQCYAPMTNSWYGIVSPDVSDRNPIDNKWYIVQVPIDSLPFRILHKREVSPPAFNDVNMFAIGTSIVINHDSSVAIIDGCTLARVGGFVSSATLASVAISPDCSQIIGLRADSVLFSVSTGWRKTTASVSLRSVTDLPVQLAPNPARSTVGLHFCLKRNVSLSVDLLDETGTLVRQAVVTEVSSGDHVIPISVVGLAGGNYIVKVTFKSSEGLTEQIVSLKIN